MTWHAARFLLLQGLALALAAAAAFVAWVVAHRRHHYLRQFRFPVRTAMAIAIIAASLLYFVQTLRGVLTDGNVVAADVRLYHTLRMFRSAALHAFYSGVTNVASAMFVIPIAVALAVLFWSHGRTYEAKLFVAAIAGAGVLSLVMPFVVQRPRPPEAVPLVGGPSFPSAHTLAASAVYGVLAFLLVRESPRKWWHLVLALLLVSLVILIPLSRVYLGLHWAHDVLASFDLSVAWLACLTMLVRFKPDGTRRGHPPTPIRARWIGSLAAAAVIYAVVLARVRVTPEARASLPPARPSADTVLTTFPDGLHKTAEDLVGGPMETVSFLFVGSAGQLRTAFERAGWTLADTPSVHGLATELFDVVRDRPDPHGPATPAYYASQPQDLTFEKPGTESGSIRHRHHIRIWQTPICIAPVCTPVWAGTCSYDMGVEFVPKPYLLTHRIDPNVDREREYISADLRGSGATDLRQVAVTPPRHGRNAGGDTFTTDGRAHVMLLTNVRE